MPFDNVLKMSFLSYQFENYNHLTLSKKYLFHIKRLGL